MARKLETRSSKAPGGRMQRHRGQGVLAERGGNTAKIKADEPRLFSDTPMQGSPTGHESEGAAKAADKKDMKRRPGRRGAAMPSNIASAKNYTAIVSVNGTAYDSKQATRAIRRGDGEEQTG